MATIDDIINGSFAAVGAPPSYMTPAYNPADYASIYAQPRPAAATPTYQPGMMGRGLPASYSPRLPGGENQQRIRLADGRYVEVNAANMPKGKQPVEITVNGGNPALANIPIPRMRPSFGDPIWTAENGVDPYPASYKVIPATGSNVKVASGMPGPSLDDLLTYAKSLPDETAANPAVAAATAAGQPVTNVTAAMKPQRRGGLFDMLFGGNNANAGGGGRGLFGMVNGPSPADAYEAANLGAMANAQTKRSTLSGVGTNGYTYVNGQNMGYSDAEKAKRAAQGQAIGDANRKNPNPTYSKSGENNSFMPKSYQNSLRQQTGY